MGNLNVFGLNKLDNNNNDKEWLPIYSFFNFIDEDFR